MEPCGINSGCPVILFINCYEEMATGMRILAKIAQDDGYDARIIVMRGYSVAVANTLMKSSNSSHVLVNGKFHLNACEEEAITQEELSLLQQETQRLRPVMVCISSRSRNDAIMPELLRHVREAAPSAPVICGGYGPTYAPEYYLRQGANLVIRGEGEGAMRDLLHCHRNKLPFTTIQNACYLQDDSLVCNPLRPLLRTLSENVSPSPLTGDEYAVFISDNEIQRHDPAYNNKTFNILIGRGCIGQCSYCAAPVQGMMYKEEGQVAPHYRRRGYEQALRELEEAKRNGAEKVFIKDEYLVDSPDRLTDFFRAYAERIGLPFKANLHSAQLLRHDRLRQAAIDAGLYSYSIGFQAGNEHMACAVYNRKHKFAELLELSRLLHDEFVGLQFHFISGTTLNTEAEFLDKCKLIRLLPYDVSFPWQTLLFDFQFYPQPLSALTKDMVNGRLMRQPVEIWAEKAILAQLHQVTASDDQLREILEEMPRGKGRVEYLQQAYQRMLEWKQEDYYRIMARQLAGKEIFVVGEKTLAYKHWWALFESARISAYIALPQDGRGTISRLADAPDVPLLVFGNSLAKMKILHSAQGISNKIFTVAEKYCLQEDGA